MHRMVTASLLVNVAVLVPVLGGMLMEAAWVEPAYGSTTPARQILLSVYVAILFLSVALLVRRDERAAIPLLLVQVVYKATSVVAVGTLANPVVASNTAIALLHATTLAVVRRAATARGVPPGAESLSAACPPSRR